MYCVIVCIYIWIFWRLKKFQLEKVPVEELEELARKCLLSVVFSFSVGELLYPESARNSVRLSTEIRNLSMMNELYPSPPEAASNFGSVWSASSQSNKV